jgi:hypothetical protein
MIPFSVLHLC